jgi:hypothetical protein
VYRHICKYICLYKHTYKFHFPGLNVSSDFIKSFGSKSTDPDVLDTGRSTRTAGGTYTERSKMKKKIELKQKDEILPGF